MGKILEINFNLLKGKLYFKYWLVYILKWKFVLICVYVWEKYIFYKIMLEKIYIYIGRYLCVSSVWLFIIFYNEIFFIDVILYWLVLKKNFN